MTSQVIFDIAEIIRNASEQEFADYLASENYFFSKYGELKDEYRELFEERRQSGKFHGETWGTFVREIRLWKDLDLRYMYSRIMQLSQEFKGNLEYFDIQTERGTYVVPDRITILNKLLQLSRELLFEIVPQIEQSVNYESDSIKDDSLTIRGKIDWHETIVNAAKQSMKIPVSFTSIVPVREFNTSENLLMLISLYWIKNDSVRLMRNHVPQELSKKEISQLQQIFVNTNYVLERTVLGELKENAKSLSSIGQKNRKIDSIISETEERIHLGLIRTPVYKKLVEWIEKYRHFGTEKFSKDLTNFRVEQTEDVDTMYELWILFELMRYLDTTNVIQYEPIIKKNRKFHGFSLKIGRKRINLKYQESYPGQIYHTQPDYTLERNSEDVPIVLDAKNWRNEKTEAKNKMIVYLVDLFPKNTKQGILFFPNNTRLDENKDTPYYEKPFKMGDHDVSLITCVLKPSSEETIQGKNNLVLKNIAELLIKVLK